MNMIQGGGWWVFCRPVGRGGRVLVGFGVWTSRMTGGAGRNWQGVGSWDPSGRSVPLRPRGVTAGGRQGPGTVALHRAGYLE